MPHTTDCTVTFRDRHFFILRMAGTFSPLLAGAGGSEQTQRFAHVQPLAALAYMHMLAIG